LEAQSFREGPKDTANQSSFFSKNCAVQAKAKNQGLRKKQKQKRSSKKK
jgi:hypothetical protein